MKFLIPLFFISSAFALNVVPVDSFSLPPGLEPIAITADGAGRIFILDTDGRLVAVEKKSVIIAELDPMTSAVDWVEPVDIDYSAGWLYIADRAGGAIYLTDRNLREPAKIELPISGQTIRPAEFAVSTDGRILVRDDERAELLLFTNWRDKDPLEIILPKRAISKNIGGIEFDIGRRRFIIISEDKIILCSLLGELEIIPFRVFPEMEDTTSLEILTAFTADSRTFCIDTRGFYSIADARNLCELNPPGSFDEPLLCAVYTLKGRIITVDRNKLTIWEFRE